MAVKIITDSACDINRDSKWDLDVEIIPLRVTFGDTDYMDGETLSHDEFFEKLIETDVLPITSQIPPYTYEKHFRSALDDGNEVLYISISSSLSGCYQSACIAADDIESDKIFIVDSQNASLGQYALVKRALELASQGKDAAEIKEILDDEKKKICLLALIDTLEYLQKGGRLSKGAALVGNLISIKPVITVKNGEVELLGKARGSKRGNNLLTEMIEASGGIDYSKPLILAYSGLSDHLLKKYVSDVRHHFDESLDHDNTPVITIGAAIGTHIGPGAIGIAFFKN